MRIKPEIIKELRTIPGVGKSIAEDLWPANRSLGVGWNLGIRSVSDLKNKDPEKLYEQLCELHGTQVDRCMLYVFRCAVYFASTKKHKPELLKWWNWKQHE